MQPKIVQNVVKLPQILFLLTLLIIMVIATFTMEAEISQFLYICHEKLLKRAAFLFL